MSIFAELGKLIGVREDQALDVMRSERSVRESLAMSRRRLLVGAGAVAAGSAFGFLKAWQLVAPTFNGVPLPWLPTRVSPLDDLRREQDRVTAEFDGPGKRLRVSFFIMPISMYPHFSRETLGR